MIIYCNEKRKYKIYVVKTIENVPKYIYIELFWQIYSQQKI